MREVLTAKSIDETLVCDHSNESYWEVVSCGTDKFITLYKVVQTFSPLDETLVCGHLNESYCLVISCGTVSYVVQLSGF